MPKRARIASETASIESFLLDAEAHSDESWFVYLLALSDCSAFKVGFSCNPLQRICTFTRRYFERFDLSQSVLMRVPLCEVARALEAQVKTEFAAQRMSAPTWVPPDAGGHTEWFSAVYFSDAEARIKASVGASEQATLIGAYDYVRATLERARLGFEPWALREAQRMSDAWSAMQRGYFVRDHSGGLRDWLDAYRYFDLPLFADEPDALNYVRACAQSPLDL